MGVVPAMGLGAPHARQASIPRLCPLAYTHLMWKPFIKKCLSYAHWCPGLTPGLFRNIWGAGD